ncbi:MAG: lipoprotein LpqH [Mycobacterium sp.]|uniref:lipoprotein LpqH n=1 Tax=Mycobacterium sp. TaxID=1785 RepID=UPI003BB79A56
MKNGIGLAAAAVLMIGITAGCSSDKAAPPRPGVLPPGTAALTIDGKDVGTTYSVRCESIEWMTRIHTALDKSGMTAMLSNANHLKAEFVRFQDLGGFTGSYERELQGEATVTMTGPTYHITGAALGFNDAKRTQLAAETFAITVSC